MADYLQLICQLNKFQTVNRYDLIVHDSAHNHALYSPLHSQCSLSLSQTRDPLQRAMGVSMSFQIQSEGHHT